MAITRRTSPRFTLTHHLQVLIKRSGQGIWQFGRYTESVPYDVLIEANVQPMNYRELVMMPESDRTKEWIKVYSSEELRTLREGDDGYQADVVVWDNQLYKVMKCKNYKMGVLDHFCAYAAREPISAGPV